MADSAAKSELAAMLAAADTVHDHGGLRPLRPRNLDAEDRRLTLQTAWAAQLKRRRLTGTRRPRSVQTPVRDLRRGRIRPRGAVPEGA